MINKQHFVCKFLVYQSNTFTESDVFSFTNCVDLKRYRPYCFGPFSLFAREVLDSSLYKMVILETHLRTKIRFIRITVITRAVPLMVSYQFLREQYTQLSMQYTWHNLDGSHCFKEHVKSNYLVSEILKVIKFFNSLNIRFFSIRTKLWFIQSCPRLFVI